MEDKLNSVHRLVKEIQETVEEMRIASQGYMSHNKASNIALKITDAIQGDPARYFTSEDHEFEIRGGDRVEVYDCQIRVDDEDLLREDIVDTLLDYYGEPQAEPPRDNPVQFNSVPEENKEEGHDATTGALAK
jgi:hypothetical protein|tara:strand:+ start:206 stop:604 length:399 start_codon:yes stop_codon:yes gene_type:complete